MKIIRERKIPLVFLITTFLIMGVFVNVNAGENKINIREQINMENLFETNNDPIINIETDLNKIIEDEETLWISLTPDGHIIIEETTSNNVPQITTIDSDESGFSALIGTPGFCITPKTTTEGRFIDLHWLDAAYIGDIGEPKIPTVRSLFIAPLDAEVSLSFNEIIEASLNLDEIGLPWRVLPVQPPIVKLPGEIENAQFQYKKSAYAQTIYPNQQVNIKEIGIVRGQRLFLLEVCPIKYNPIEHELTFYPEVEVNIRFEGAMTSENNLNPLPGIDSIVLNPELHPLDSRSETGNYYIIVASEYESDITSFADAKAAQGFTIFTYSVAPGTTKETIKGYIEDQYAGSDPPDFILLVGDTDTIPNWVGGGAGSPATDLNYVCMDGPTDWYPDIPIGRFSVRSPSELQAIVDKTLYYENGPLADPDYVMRAVFMASEDNWPVSEGTHNWVIENYMDPNNITSDKLYCHTYGATTQDVRDSFNDGRFYGIYSGHGGTYSWADGPPFSQSDVNNLMNENMYPFVGSFACVTGTYTVTECFTETWIRAEDKGAIAIYGSSVNSYWTEDDVLEKRLFDAIYDEDDDVPMQVGPVWIDALMRYLAQMGSGSTTRRYFEMYNLLGDPSLFFPGASLGPLNINFPNNLPKILSPYEPTELTVRIFEGDEEYIDGTGMLYYRYDDGDFLTSPLTPIGGDLYLATFPTPSCGDTPEFYFSAEGTESGTIYSPADAPTSVYIASVGYFVFADDFETDQGWTVENINLTTGAWERGVPIGGGLRGDPVQDYDGSGQCYLTENAPGNTDVDGGPTRLISPTFDLTGNPNPVLNYARWFTNDDQDQDRLDVEISNDNGASWTLIESVPDTEGWVVQSKNILDFVTITSQIKVRFCVSDVPNNSQTEAAIDAFDITVNNCSESPLFVLDGNCYYDEGKTISADNVNVFVLNLNTSMSWWADTVDNSYSLELQPEVDINVYDELRIIARDDTNWITVIDHIVTQGEIDSRGVTIDLILDEYYLDLTDFPMYEAQDIGGYTVDQMTGPAVLQMNLDYMWWNSSVDIDPPTWSENNGWDQAELYDRGLENNSNTSLGYLDATGLHHMIQNLDPAPYSEYGYNFGIYHNADSDIMLAQICQWVDYPAGIKPGHPENVPGAVPAFGDYSRWISIRGIHTNQSVYPLPSAFDVYGFWANDPYPSSLGGIGENSYKTSNEWTGTYYQQISVTDDPYNGEYVAICEPPIEGDCDLTLVPSPERWEPLDGQPGLKPGMTSFFLRQVTDNTVVKAAIDGVTDQLIPYDSGFEEVFEQSYAGRPLIIKNLAEEKGDYYAVPFTNVPTTQPIEMGSEEVEEDITTIVVLVDANDGHFKEASWVQEPVKYLPISDTDALDLVFDELIDMGINPDDLNMREIKTDLVYRDSTPYYPDWRVVISELDLEFFVSQEGVLT